jgi:lipoprotein Spr/probable lipoprotein NlpC
LSLASCGSHRALTASRAERVSRQLGFPVDRRDPLPLLETAASWLGVPFRPGGETRSGVDCSGLARAIYREAYGARLHRTVSEMYRMDARRVRRVKPGDLLFFAFDDKRPRVLSHVGIFLKEGYFIHASTSRGVVVSHLDRPYYKQRWKRTGRPRRV